MKRSYIKPKKSKHNWPAMCEAVQERSGGICEKCGKWIGVITPCNVHHIIARGKAGGDDIDNLICLCSSMEFWGKEDLSCHTAEHFK